MHHPTDRIIQDKAFVTPVVEHWLERDDSIIAKCVVVFLTIINFTKQNILI